MIFITKRILVSYTSIYLSTYSYLLNNLSSPTCTCLMRPSCIRHRGRQVPHVFLMGSVRICDFLIHSLRLLFCWWTCQVKSNRASHWVFSTDSYKIISANELDRFTVKNKGVWHQVDADSIELLSDTVFWKVSEDLKSNIEKNLQAMRK